MADDLKWKFFASDSPLEEFGIKWPECRDGTRRLSLVRAEIVPDFVKQLPAMLQDDDLSCHNLEVISDVLGAPGVQWNLRKLKGEPPAELMDALRFQQPPEVMRGIHVIADYFVKLTGDIDRFYPYLVTKNNLRQLDAWANTWRMMSADHWLGLRCDSYSSDNNAFLEMMASRAGSFSKKDGFWDTYCGAVSSGPGFLRPDLAPLADGYHYLALPEEELEAAHQISNYQAFADFVADRGDCYYHAPKDANCWDALGPIGQPWGYRFASGWHREPSTWWYTVTHANEVDTLLDHALPWLEENLESTNWFCWLPSRKSITLQEAVDRMREFWELAREKNYAVVATW